MSSAKYIAEGSNVTLVFWNGETRLAATCDNASRAADLLNRARIANDVKRQYTRAARLMAEAEALPAFAWAAEALTP